MDIGLESKFYKFANTLYNIMVINFFILLGYFSIIFLGGFQATSDYICRKIISKEDYKIRLAFRKYFYSNFKKTLVVSIIYIVIFLSFMISYIEKKSEILFILFVYINTFFYIFTFIIGNYKTKVVDGIKNSLSILNLHFYIMIINYGIIKLILFLLAKNVFLFIILGLGIHKYIMANIIYIVLQKSIINKKEIGLWRNI